MTNEERVATLPKLVNTLGDDREDAFREILAEMLADIARRPNDLLLLMKPTRQGMHAVPPRLSKLLERADDEIHARAVRMSGELSAMAEASGISADKIISLRMDAPGIAVQVGGDQSNQALIVCEGGEWQARAYRPMSSNISILPVESAEEAVRIVSMFAAPRRRHTAH